VLLAPTLVSNDVDFINELLAVWFDQAQFSRRRKGPAVVQSGRSVRAVKLCRGWCLAVVHGNALCQTLEYDRISLR
jgi:hypothetical protein